jgi:phosphoribosylaminoimidazole-succinocarboxamide synthase
VLTLADYPHLSSGKVRDLYAVDEEHVLVVASDRISAYDHVLATPIPDKGRILTALSAWWFERLAAVVPNHLVSVDDARIPAAERGRAMLVRRLEMYPVECVARGYLTGSGLLDYRAGGEVCGIALPAGLDDGSRLPEPIFTPATKATIGEHDENIGYAQVVATVGEPAAVELRDRTLAVYQAAERLARDRGIILADTKFEFGVLPGGAEPILGDEVLTPDSSRFWPADQWEPGRAQPSYDKQYVRDWLSQESGWDRAGPPPPLPEDVVGATRQRYVEAYEKITGLAWES